MCGKRCIDDKGNQKTANYMMADKKGILSEVYQDLETNVRIRTFSYPIQSGYLFLDLRID